ncbi:MAG: efflux RND transporter permease subunit [Elusimicrobiota bacterium]
MDQTRHDRPPEPPPPMSERFIAYFAGRHLLTNLTFLVVLLGGAYAWRQTRKEEMPSVTFDRVRVSVRYPGAPAEDVEYFVTKPVEENLRGLDGVYRLESTSSVGQASVSIELEPDLPNMDEVVMEIRNAVLDTKFPDDVIDDPSIRIFKTAKMAILDIAVYNKDVPMLDLEKRRELQRYAFALENQLLNLPHVNSINKSGYLQEEIQVRVHPDKLVRYDIPFNAILREIRANHLRQPAGTIEAKGEPKVTLLSELNTPARLGDLVVQGGFEGQVIRLKEAADIESGYEKNMQVIKVNGREAVMLNVVKSPSYGILDSLDAVRKVLESYRKRNLKGTTFEAVMLDDESIDVRNRLSLIGINGSIGFLLILATLFIFLDKQSGFWVAMGIPFSLCMTMIASNWLGYTINGTTLAAVIIVLGIVVDDAIVVAENITREIQKGVARNVAAVKATAYVMLPILASITTTCVAFIPLFFFSGHFGRFVTFIPPIIFLMLGASLFESVLILPGHMAMKMRLPWSKRIENGVMDAPGHWFGRVEDRYGRFLEKVLPYKWLVFLGLILLLVLSGFLITKRMKFVMFPAEETRDITLTGLTPPDSTRYDTAKMTQNIEDIIVPMIGKEVVGFRTMIARGRRGGAVQENQFRTLIEIVPKEKRERSADEIVSELEEKIGRLEGFTKIQFRKSRWGQSSGSPIELLVQQNDDALRREIVDEMKRKFQEHPALANAEIDEGFFTQEYRISLDREKIKRLSITPTDVSSTFRAALEGIVVYEFSNGDEEVRVRLTTVDSAKDDIEKVLSIPVENTRNYLVPLRNIVSIEKVVSPTSISRRDMKRTTRVYADMADGAKMTPLEVADDLEANVFPDILSKHPTTTLAFTGEVEDTRESKKDFRNAVLLAVLLIYVILAILFDSAVKPLLIMLAIPFGVVGVALAFFLHGKVLFGFFAAVGALGLSGVVINDSIVMLVKLDDELKDGPSPADCDRRIADVAKTRLRAVVLTTLTTVVGVLPTAYGLAGYDAMLAEMMLALSWGLVFGTVITLVLIPCLCSLEQGIRARLRREDAG